MATEKLKFKLELYSTFWDKKPTCEVLINGVSRWNDVVDGSDQDPTVIEFEHECEEGKQYELILDRKGKDKTQTIVNDKGDILHDQMLHIKSVEIDEIEIGTLVYEGIYKPNYPEPWATQQHEAGVDLPQTCKNVTVMGHNGTWTFRFSSPFYMWLLENLY
jgi:hypothetical protein|tara:strand:- start:59 stop:541 length:483 start_codon:yes stop_codon:yes gene_type:complete